MRWETLLQKKVINRQGINSQQIENLPCDKTYQEIVDKYRGFETIYFSENTKIVGCISLELVQYLAEKLSGSFLLAIVEKIEEGIVAIDENGRIFFANENYSKILGVPLHKVIGKYMQDIEKNASINDVLKTRLNITRKNNHIVTIDKYVNVAIHPLYISGKFQGAFSIFSDVTKINQLHKEVERISQVAEEYQVQLQSQEISQKMNIIGRDPTFLQTLNKALIVAKTEAPVLVFGENGSGKDIISHFIYRNSRRNQKPFITLNCAAIPDNLIESEMFGFTEGSFTGAKKGGKVGKFQLADQGTLFLDEIGDMSLAMQSKLLRALETGEIEQVGSEKNISVNVRIIAATNQDLNLKIKEGTFREDLYYRLSVMELTVPPLRQRGLDIMEFAEFFLQESNMKYNKNAIFSQEVYNVLFQYSWPGNVRELRNAVEHSVILAEEDVVYIKNFPLKIQKAVNYQPQQTLQQQLEKIEQDLILKALKRNNYNRFQTILELGLTERTFYRKLKKYEISLP